MAEEERKKLMPVLSERTEDKCSQRGLKTLYKINDCIKIHCFVILLRPKKLKNFRVARPQIYLMKVYNCTIDLIITSRFPSQGKIVRYNEMCVSDRIVFPKDRGHRFN